MSTRQALVALILLSAALRFGFAASVGLGVDESYMIAAGRSIGLGYFDHPPAAWWLSSGIAHLAGTEAPVVVRAPFILLFAVSTWLMARLGAVVATESAGLWAALLFNLSPVFGVTTGSWVLPDGPLDAALLAASLCLVHALHKRNHDPGAWVWWVGAGVSAGLALFSKYSAVLTLGGAFVYLLASPLHRSRLARAQPYVAALLALLVFSPVILWNATHDWASFAFQGERAGGWRFRPLAPLTTLAGEAMFVLPWIWLPMMATAIGALRAGPKLWRPWLLACLAAPPIVLFALVSAWSSRRILFHWAAPGYLMLFPLLGWAAAQRADRPWVRRSVAATAALIVCAVAVIGAQTRYDILGDSLITMMRKDPTIEGVNWTSLRTNLASRGLLTPATVVGVPNWRDAGKIGYGLGPDVTLLCLSTDARQFGIATPPTDYLGRDILVLIADNPDATIAGLAPLFETIEALPPAPVLLGQRVLRQIAVYRAHRLLAWPPP